jgi:flagellar biogenesis protein FliO
MPSFGPIELIVLLIVLAFIVGVVMLVIKLIGRASNGGQRSRIETLENRVRELENRP